LKLLLTVYGGVITKITLLLFVPKEAQALIIFLVGGLKRAEQTSSGEKYAPV